MIWPQPNPIWLILLAILCICAWLGLHYWERISLFMRNIKATKPTVPSAKDGEHHDFSSNAKVYFIMLLSIGALVVVVAYILQTDRELMSSDGVEVSAPMTDSESPPSAPENPDVPAAPATPPKKDISTTTGVAQDRVFTPRTPRELMDIAINQTRRDAMEHKGSWIRVEGPILDISEVMKRYFGGDTRHKYIKIKIGIEPPPDYPFPREVDLYVSADRWQSQVARIERDDWLVADGVVEYVHKIRMEVIDGEIISVSGEDEGEQ